MSTTMAGLSSRGALILRHCKRVRPLSAAGSRARSLATKGGPRQQGQRLKSGSNTCREDKYLPILPMLPTNILQDQSCNYTTAAGNLRNKRTLASAPRVSEPYTATPAPEFPNVVLEDAVVADACRRYADKDAVFVVSGSG